VAARFASALEGLLAVDPLEFRGIIGHFVTGVTVITTAAGDQLHGMTANAVSSLSLDPVMVLICVDKSTHTHRVLDQGGVFTVNILGEQQESVSRIFAKKSEPETGTLRGQAFRRGETGAPILEGCLAYVECRVVNVMEGGDHSIFLGEVVSEGVKEEMRPLLFYRGGYHTLGV
jgi:flavin reductase (DIM6/NTAB) family NADH-FMN oxidoreductase RutF